MRIAERVRQTIASVPISDGDNRIDVTASFGVTTYSGEDEPSHQLLKRVGVALCDAMTAGRNRTVFNGGDDNLSDVA